MIQTPIGSAILKANNASICGLHLQDNPAVMHAEESAVCIKVQQELDAYFAGALREFKVPLSLIGTSFQKAVWAAVQHVPYGKTCSYADIARAIGKPKAVRAVANAIGANPIWIIVPCHRVIRSNGGLGGYAGGLERKRWLLAHERQQSRR